MATLACKTTLCFHGKAKTYMGLARAELLGAWFGPVESALGKPVGGVGILPGLGLHAFACKPLTEALWEPMRCWQGSSVSDSGRRSVRVLGQRLFVGQFRDPDRSLP